MLPQRWPLPSVYMMCLSSLKMLNFLNPLSPDLLSLSASSIAFHFTIAIAIAITITMPLPQPSRRRLHRVVVGIATREERKEKKEKRGYAPNARIVPHAIILRIRSHIPRKRYSRAEPTIARRPLPPSDASRRRDTRISGAGVAVAISVVGTVLFFSSSAFASFRQTWGHEERAVDLTYHNGGIGISAIHKMDSLAALDDTAARAFICLWASRVAVDVGISGDRN